MTQTLEQTVGSIVDSVKPNPNFRFIEAARPYAEQPEARSKIFSIFYRMIEEINQSNYKSKSSEVLARIDKAYSDNYIIKAQQLALVDSLKSKVNEYALSHYRDHGHSEKRRLMNLAREIARGN